MLVCSIPGYKEVAAEIDRCQRWGHAEPAQIERAVESAPEPILSSPWLRPSSPIRSRRSRRPFAPGSRRVSRRPRRPSRRAGRPSPEARHAHPRAHGEWQDPGRLPVHPRPPRPAPEPTSPEGPARQRARPVHLTLKALTYDVERNLRAPLTGIGLAAQRLGEAPPQISVASRTGDTPPEDRREIARHAPDILVTTPESLYLLLTSQAREILRGVEHVIVDEVHAIAGTKRRDHLALSLERLELSEPRARPRRSGSACPPPSGRSRRSPGSSAASGLIARSRSSMRGRESRSTSRSSCRSTT